MMKATTVCCLLLVTVGLAADQTFKEAVSLYYYGKYDQAVRLLSQISASQGDAEVHFWLGRANLKLRKYDDAIRELQEAVRIEPNNGRYHLWLGRAYGEKASHVSFFSSPGWARKVAQEFESAVKLSPQDMEARFDLLQFYLEAPGIVGGGRAKAEAEAKEIATAKPVQGFRARAMIYEQDKKWAEARQELTRATTEFPKEPIAFTNLADFLMDRRDYAGAESSAGKALELDQNDVKARFIQSAAAVGLKRDLPAAEKTLSGLAAGPLENADPGFEDVYYWLGRIYLEEGKTSEARQAFQTALTFDPEHKAAKTALANMHS